MKAMKLNLILVLLAAQYLTGCNPLSGDIVPSTALLNNPLNPSDPKNAKDPTPKETPSPTPTFVQPKACSGVTGEICKGGYDADQNQKKIPAKIIFMDLNDQNGTAQGISAQDQKTMAENIIKTANDNLVINGHKLIQFKDAEYSYVGAPSPSTVINDIDKMITDYGSTSHYVLVIVKDFMKYSQGVIGYSPGLRINWKSKESIVVMDYNYIKTAQSGATVIVHELFHGLGAPHTTDNNGSNDNIFQAGLVVYKDMKYGSGTGQSQGQYILNDRTMAYDFKIYLEDQGSFLGIRNNGGFNWDTRTMMYQYAKPYPLFLNSDTAFNGSYSNILNVYYDSFVK